MCALVPGVQTCALPISVAGLGRGAGQRLMPADARPGETVFVDRLHQPGPLTILGKVSDQPGPKQAEAVLRDLAVHPATARHVATKLARHFSGDQNGRASCRERWVSQCEYWWLADHS